jgi:hypothetical protein
MRDFEPIKLIGISKGGTIIFEGSAPQIDFSKSRQAAISIFHNPSVDETKGCHKYYNPTDFSPSIMKGEQMYFCIFMLINSTDGPSQHNNGSH